MREEAERSDDPQVRESPFVFLMNKVKYEQFQEDDYLRVPQSFSMFNRQTEFPFDPVPNVFKIAPDAEDTNWFQQW